MKFIVRVLHRPNCAIHTHMGHYHIQMACGETTEEAWEWANKLAKDYDCITKFWVEEEKDE